jgi:predicted secreted hydrolase
VTYWEGEVKIDGTKNRTPVAGRGYAELTGYASGMGAGF